MINAVSDGRTITENGGLIKQMGEKALVYAEVVNDYSHLKISPSSSFYDDYTPVNKGMRDYISGREGSYYKLNFGAYISESDIEITEGRVFRPLDDRIRQNAHTLAGLRDGIFVLLFQIVVRL